MHLLPHLAVLMAALAVDAAFGYPDRLFRAIGHPVVWIGAVIARLDRGLNRDGWGAATRRMAGVAAVALLIAITVAPTLVLNRLAGLLPPLAAIALLALLASSLIAQRSLWDHVAAVADALETGGLPAGRRAVSMIVGRNPDVLDEAGVVRAAIESLAENFSDGVVAPALWCALGGLPGLVFYKAVNTADSMIGHRTPRHQAFGWAAARLDDVVNLPASRLSALWLVMAALIQRGAGVRSALRAVWRDAGRHRSPNAGWPEAAMAGALGLRLAGPRVYGATLVDDAWMGDGHPQATPADLRRALALYRRACAIEFATVAAMLLAVSAQG